MKAFQTLLDGSETAFEKSVDIELLRKLCATGELHILCAAADW